MDKVLYFFFFEWLAKVRVWSLQLVSFLVGLRTYQHPGNKVTYFSKVSDLKVWVISTSENSYTVPD